MQAAKIMSYVPWEHQNPDLYDEEISEFRRVRAYASSQLDVPYDDVSVERLEYDINGMFVATVSIPWGDGYNYVTLRELESECVA